MKHAPTTDPSIMALGIIAAVSILTLMIYIWMLVWVYHDAEHRGKSGCLSSLVVFFLGFPIGLIAWLIFRPEERRRTRRRRSR